MSDYGQSNGITAYTREAAVAYGEGEAVLPGSANAFVISCALVGDVLANPDGHIRLASGVATIGYPTHMDNGATVLDVGADFAGALPVDETSRRYVLALRDVVREQFAMRDRVLPGERSGALAPWAAAGLVLLAAGVVSYLAATGINAFRDIRREQLQIAQAGSDRAEGLRVYRETGRMPPPSPVEQATADAIRRRAEREAAQPSPFAILAAGAASGAKWGIILLLGGIGAWFWSSSKKG